MAAPDVGRWGLQFRHREQWILIWASDTCQCDAPLSMGKNHLGPRLYRIFFDECRRLRNSRKVSFAHTRQGIVGHEKDSLQVGLLFSNVSIWKSLKNESYHAFLLFGILCACVSSTNFIKNVHS